jgi:hypothetical protein
MTSERCAHCVDHELIDLRRFVRGSHTIRRHFLNAATLMQAQPVGSQVIGRVVPHRKPVVEALTQSLQARASARKRRAFAEAAPWVAIKGTSYPFSFDRVCDALNTAHRAKVLARQNSIWHAQELRRLNGAF